MLALCVQSTKSVSKGKSLSGIGCKPARGEPTLEAEEAALSLPILWGRPTSLGSSTLSSPCWSSWRRWQCRSSSRSTRQSPLPASTTCQTGRGWWGHPGLWSESWDGQTWDGNDEGAGVAPGKETKLLLKSTSALASFSSIAAADISWRQRGRNRNGSKALSRPQKSRL